MKLPSNIKISKFAQIKEIIKKKDWPTNDILFEKICGILVYFSDEQQDLIIELLNHYLLVSMNEYPKYFESMFHDVDFTGISKLYVLPLLKEDDFGGIKSSTFILYMLKGWGIILPENLDIYFIERAEQIGKDMSNKKIILVDDFVGTGDTALAACEHLYYDFGVSYKNIMIFTIVSLEEGKKRLRDQNIQIFCSFTCNRGISDKYSSPIKEEYLSIMHAIEEKIDVREYERLGYKQSEALVSLHRTPNNTFPVYRYSKKFKDGTQYEGPFKR